MPGSVGPLSGGRRRLDRVLGEDFLTGLERVDLDGLRARRREAEQEETDLSYVRRLLQGRADIVRAELARRASGGTESVSDPAVLARILADDDDPISRGMSRFFALEPTRVDEHRRAVEQLVSDVEISDVEARDDDELRAALARLDAFERQVSLARARVHEVIEACVAELGRRYRDGSVDPTDVLSAE